MARQNIENNESGLTVRNKINQNFVELYASSGGGGGGGGGVIRPPYVAGRSYVVENVVTAAAGGALAANTLALRPFIVDADVTISGMSVRVGTAHAGGLFRFGIWASGGNGLPTGLPLAESAERATDSAVTITHNIVVPIVLTRGIYWVGWVQNNSTARLLVPANTVLTPVTFLYGETTPLGSYNNIDFQIAHTFGPLPNLTSASVLAGASTNLRAPLLSITVAT